MTNVLLISEDYVKTNSNINDNLWGKFLLPAIREAQEIGLQSIIGECLYRKLIQLVADGSIHNPENAAYKSLLDDYIQPYLLYRVMSDSAYIIDVKMANIGTVRSKDEYVENISDSERERLQNHYQTRADHYCKRLQLALINSSFPEIDECQCNELKAHLNSAATTGLWLGGERAYYVRPYPQRYGI